VEATKVKENRITRLRLGDILYCLIRYICVEAGEQETGSYIEYLLACDFFHLNRTGKQNTRVQHHLKNPIVSGILCKQFS